MRGRLGPAANHPRRGAAHRPGLLLAGPGLRAFTGWRQAVAYAGLCPRHYESGSSVRGRARLSKLGDGRLRRLLYVGAWSASRANAPCAALYQRLLDRGKAKPQALCAVAARLLRQAGALLTYERDFDPNSHLSLALQTQFLLSVAEHLACVVCAVQRRERDASASSA